MSHGSRKYAKFLRVAGPFLVVTSLLVSGVGQSISDASTAKKPSVRVKIVNSSIEINTKDQFKLCGTSLPAGSKAYLQEQEGTNRVWRTVWSVGKLQGSHCVARMISTPLQGRHVFRARVWLSKKVPLDSANSVQTVYGPVAFKTWCSAVAGCQLVNGAGGPIQVGNNIDNYVDWVCGSTGQGYCSNLGANYFTASYTLNSPNSCRSLTFDTVLLASDNGNTGGAVTIEAVQHTLNPQDVTPVFNQVTSATVALDGGPVVFNFTNTGPLSLYILSETADCYTPTGTLTTTNG